MLLYDMAALHAREERVGEKERARERERERESTRSCLKHEHTQHAMM